MNRGIMKQSVAKWDKNSFKNPSISLGEVWGKVQSIYKWIGKFYRGMN